MLTHWERIGGWMARRHKAFKKAMGDPVRVQQRVLMGILRANGQTDFGLRHGFSSIRDSEDYRRGVPVSQYEDLAADIERMARGEENVLCRARPVAFEETGGSTGGPKLIPYTAASLNAFQRALDPWVFDLIKARPALTAGRAYFCISPAARPPATTPGGVPVGLPNDGAYFGEQVLPHLAEIMAVPNRLAQLENLDAWRYQTLLHLVGTPELTLISVWSPSFLLSLLDHLPTHAGSLIRDVADGTVSGGNAPPPEGMTSPLAPDPERARVLERALAGTVPDTRALWPMLDTISCWSDAGARRFLPHLKEAFPHAWVQGKGLLATEGVVSFPLARWPYPVLAVRSAFFEFLDDSGASHLAHEVTGGEVYRVLLTTPGGLYRYDLGDRVRIRGFAEGLPMLEFVGRAGLVSDLVGEKLTDDFVLARLPDREGFAMLAPSMEPTPRYVLFLDSRECNGNEADQLALLMDADLMENPQYRYARRIGQLEEVRACRVDQPWERYQMAAVAEGQRLGDLKPPALSPSTEWEARLKG